MATGFVASKYTVENRTRKYWNNLARMVERFPEFSSRSVSKNEYSPLRIDIGGALEISMKITIFLFVKI